jgi:hypothetical protein
MSAILFQTDKKLKTKNSDYHSRQEDYISVKPVVKLVGIPR